MDATISNILALDETAVTATPTWAIVMVMVSVMIAIAFDVVRFLQARAEKAEVRTDQSDEKTESVKSQNDELHRQLLLKEIAGIGIQLKADQAEMRAEIKAMLTAIQASVTRHDGNIDELYRMVKVLMEWKIAIEATVKGGNGAA